MQSREVLSRLARAALSAVNPLTLLPEWWRGSGLELPRRGRIGVFAAGKAAIPMAAAFEAAVTGRQRKVEYLVVAPRGPMPDRAVGWRLLAASHPEPDRASVAAAREAMVFFRRFGKGDSLYALLSGGASSLLALPAPGVTLAEKRRVIRDLTLRGAPIEDLNAVRIALSAIKGGGLAAATQARVTTLVLSDIISGDLSLVGSGPTIPPKRRRDPRRILRRYGLDPSVLPAASRLSPLASRLSPRAYLLADNSTGLAAAAGQARRLGLRAARAERPLRGEASAAGLRFARRLLSLGRKASGVALLAGGETAVAIAGRAGRGGRSQEFALAAAYVLAGRPGADVLAFGSDGVDGSSRNAGAFADGVTLRRAWEMGLQPARALFGHDAAPFFEALGDAYVTGPTGTNVADFAFGLLY